MAADAIGPEDGRDDDAEHGQAVLEDAFSRFLELGLRLPPVPRHLVGELDEFADWRWGSDNADLEDAEGFAEAANAPTGEDSVAWGHVGHGTNSWWLCYRLQLGAVAIYLRVAYGGAYTDDAAAVETFNAAAETVEELIPAAAAAKAAGRFGAGHRLVVTLDEKAASSWYVAGRPGDPRETDDPLDAALDFLGQPAPPDDEEDDA